MAVLTDHPIGKVATDLVVTQWVHHTVKNDPVAPKMALVTPGNLMTKADPFEGLRIENPWPYHRHDAAAKKDFEMNWEGI